MERPRDSLGRPLPAGSRDRLQFDTATLPPERRSRVELARRLYDRRRFFEAHEVLERLWREESDRGARDLWKGWLQLAVGCCHAQRGNRRGATALFRRAATFLARAGAADGLDPATLARHGRRQAGRVQAADDPRQTPFLKLDETGPR